MPRMHCPALLGSEPTSCPEPRRWGALGKGGSCELQGQVGGLSCTTRCGEGPEGTV